MSHTVLHIDSSVGGDASKSRAASLAEVKKLAPSQTIRRDLASDALPFIDGLWADTRLKAPEDLTEADKDVLSLSDDLIKELQDADTIVIGAPIYNFGSPASLKAWMDLVARPRLTFQYSENGSEGLLKGKKAIIVAASGGVPIGSDADFATKHLTFFLGFIGITDVTVIDTKQLQAA